MMPILMKIGILETDEKKTSEAGEEMEDLGL
jgi:hypothetical protein